MLGKKHADSEEDLDSLAKRIAKLEKELEKVERLEQSLAQNELMLAKKIADMNRFEEKLAMLGSKNEIEELRKELKRFEEHEIALTENAKFIMELTKELGKVKESHRITRKHVIDKKPVSKNEFEERFGSVKEALKDLDDVRNTHRKKAGHEDLVKLKVEIHDRISQLEYQNKLLMQALKKVEDNLR